MLFHVVPEDIFRDRAVYPRPRCYQRNPRCQQQQLGNVGFLHDILRPLVVMSHNNSQTESCHSRRVCGTQKCQGVKRRGAQMGECPVQKPQPEAMTASLDFHGFSAEEIKVKVTDNAIVVCGRHDDPSNSFRVTRRLPLPPGVDKTGVSCRYVDGKVILEIPASAKQSVEGKPERQEHEKKAELKEARTDPTRTGDTGDNENDGGMKIEKEIQADFQQSLKHLFSTLFGLPVVERKKKTDLPNGSPGKEEQPAEQTTTDADRPDPRPEEDNKTTAGTLDHQMGFGKEEQAAKQTTTDADREDLRPEEDNTTTAGTLDKKIDVEEEKGQEKDTCLMLKYDEKQSLRHDPSDIAYVEEQTTGDSALPEETAIRKTDEDEEVERLLSDGEDDVPVKPQDNLPVALSSQDFEIRFDLSNYKPEDIRVVVRNGDVIVEAERERKCDGYSETETLRRRIRLPDKVDQSMLTSVLNAEGEMTIHAPFLSQTLTEKEEKTIPVVWE